MRRKLDMAIISTKNRVVSFFEEAKTKKSFGDSQVVVALVLIAVAIGLCILFQQNVNDIIKTLSTRVKDVVNQLSTGTVNKTA